MTTTLHIALSNCPGYIIWEAEMILSWLQEMAPYSESLSLKLSRDNMFYLSDFQANFSDQHLSASSKSRYINDALEDSFLELSGLLRSTGGNSKT